MLLMHWAHNYRNELCKSYDMDTNETFVVTRLNDCCHNIILFKMSTLSPHTSMKTTTPLVSCIVNDGLVDALPNVHQKLLEFVNVVHP